MSQAILDLLEKGKQANLEDRFRKNNIIELPKAGKLIATGDIHGNRVNFEKIAKFADLKNNPDTHVLLQEVIHGGASDNSENCLSYQLLFDAIDYKLAFPDQVHFVMSNHDTAFITDGEVLKDGKEMNVLFNKGLENAYPEMSSEVKQGIKDMLLAQALAVKTENRIWLSHSLPADRFTDVFDTGILERSLVIEDLIKPGSVYLLTWGRKHSQENLDRLAEMLDTDLFILGHQPQERGCSKAGKNLVIINSEHNHGCLLEIELDRKFTADEVLNKAVPLVSIC